MEDASPALLRAACALLGWNNGDLAEQAGLSRNTVQMMLAREELTGTMRTLRAISIVMESAGIMFVRDDSTGAIGVMLGRVAA